MVTNMQNNYHDKFMKKVGAKVSASMKDLAKTGNRNLRGVQFSAHRIIKSAENLFFQFGSQQYSDPVEAIYKGFSERPGLSNVNNIAGIDVVDINIQATQQSVLGYISAERALDKPIDTLWFQGLKALNTVGGYEKGAWVNRPYMPMKNAIRNAVRGAFAEVKDLSSPVDLSTLPGKDGQVLMETLQIVNKDGKTVGKYVDGEVYFNDGATSAKLEGTVLTVNGAASGYKLVVGIDKTTEKDGKNTLKLKPATETINVTAQPRRIALEQSYEDKLMLNNK